MRWAPCSSPSIPLVSRHAHFLTLAGKPCQTAVKGQGEILHPTPSQGWTSELPKSEKNIYEFSWIFRLKCLCSWMRLCDLSLGNSNFFLRYILETKSFTPLNKTRRIVPVPTSWWCLFTTQVLLLWAIKDTLQGKEFVQLTLFQAPMPSAPNTWKQKGHAGFRSSLQSWAPSGTCTSLLQLIACSLWYWN